MPVAVTCLRWDDVDPARHPFDPKRIGRAVEAALRDSDGDADEREAAVDRALLAELGPWIAGWSWAASEPGGGGPVAAYCCADHSLCGDVEADTATITAAIADWRDRLETLAGTFDDLLRASAGLDPAAAASHAASRLLPLILEWTGAEDAWYSTFEVVLAWFLELQLGDPEIALAIAREALDGRFGSWIAPEEPERAAACAAVGEATARLAEAQPPDGLAAWLRQRSKLRTDRDRIYDPAPVERDGHERYIDEKDAARNPDRAARMRRALDTIRAAAVAGKPLSLELLADVHAAALGFAAPLRTTDAFAHRGSERYGIAADTADKLAAFLARANDASISPIVRAARVYLDVSYFHPFADGNARAARLALDHVLTSADLALHAAGPVFLVARRALDPYGVYGLMHIIDYLAGPRRP